MKHAFKRIINVSEPNLYYGKDIVINNKCKVNICYAYQSNKSQHQSFRSQFVSCSLSSENKN